MFLNTQVAFCRNENLHYNSRDLYVQIDFFYFSNMIIYALVIGSDSVKLFVLYNDSIDFDGSFFLAFPSYLIAQHLFVESTGVGQNELTVPYV